MGIFDGKVILVTGTSSGIGRASAVAFAAEGATVVAAARREAQGADTVAAIEKAGGKGRYVATDIGDEASIDRLFAVIEKEFGRLDGAFNNAAMELPMSEIPDLAMSDFDDVIRVNVRGTFLCMRHELRFMRAQKSGAIVNTASVAGVWGITHAAAYTASKHAIVGMTKAAALEMAPHKVRVNCICPGVVRTEMMERWASRGPEVEEHLRNSNPMKRIGRPEELASSALWMLSDGASYVTGHILLADGGTTAGVSA